MGTWADSCASLIEEAIGAIEIAWLEKGTMLGAITSHLGTSLVVSG